MKLEKIDGIEKEVYKLKKDTYYSPDDNSVYVKTDDGFRVMDKAEMKSLFEKARENVTAFAKLVDEVAGKLSGKKKEKEEEGSFFD